MLLSGKVRCERAYVKISIYVKEKNKQYLICLCYMCLEGLRGI